jgi:hypothetical protein
MYCQPSRTDPGLLQGNGDTLGSALRQLLVVGLTADCIGVPFNRHKSATGLAVQDIGNVTHLGPGICRQVSPVKRKQNVGEIYDHSSVGFLRVKIAPLELFEDLTVAGQLLALAFNVLLLLSSHRIPLLQLIANKRSRACPKRCPNCRPGGRLADRRPNDRAGCAADKTTGEGAFFPGAYRLRTSRE